MARYNEYGLGKLSGTVSMTKVKNALKREHPNLVPHVSNIRINGQLQGCSGFVEDPASGRLVYFSADVNHGTSRQAYVRNAKHLKDYTGGRNRFCDMDASAIVELAAELLASGDLS